MNRTATMMVSLALLLAALPTNANEQEGGKQESRDWDLTVGVTTLHFPVYPGAAEQRTLLTPVGRFTYRERFYVGTSTTDIGAAVGTVAARSEHLTWSFEYVMTENRKERRADSLAGMGDRPTGEFATSTLLYRGGLASLTVMRGLADNAGTVAILGAGIGGELGPRLTGSVGIKAHFADGDNLNYDYGISAAQALRRAALVEAGDTRIGEEALHPYASGSGLKLARLEAGVTYPLSSQWSLVSFAGVTRVMGDAANSPLTTRRDTLTVGFNASYRF